MIKKIKSILFILLLSALSTFSLLYFESITTDKIKFNNEIRLKTSMLLLLDIISAKDEVNSLFDKNIKSININNKKIYSTIDEKYIVQFNDIGLWGKINGLILLKNDMKTIERVRIISHEETPGIGSKISDVNYLENYKNAVIDPKLILCVRNKAIKNNEIDAISGATFSSEALLNAINKTVKSLKG